MTDLIELTQEQLIFVCGGAGGGGAKGSGNGTGEEREPSMRQSVSDANYFLDGGSSLGGPVYSGGTGLKGEKLVPVRAN